MLKSINIRSYRRLKWKKESLTHKEAEKLTLFSIVEEFCKMLMTWITDVIIHVAY